MGKYNFSAMKFEEILKRLEALEQSNEELRKENAELRKREYITKPRVVSESIANYDKARELFGIKAENGKLVPCEERTRTNFGVFYQNIFRALCPAVREYDGKQSIVYTPITSLTDEEYKIHAETLEAVIDIIYYAKAKLKGEK